MWPSLSSLVHFKCASQAKGRYALEVSSRNESFKNKGAPNVDPKRLDPSKDTRIGSPNLWKLPNWACVVTLSAFVITVIHLISNAILVVPIVW